MKIYLFLPLAFPLLLYSQDFEQYNKIYLQTYYKTASENLPKALKVADSLYTHSPGPILKIKSLMLSATLQNEAGEFKKSIDRALEAKKIAQSIKDNSWQARTAGFLASTFRNLHLHRISKEYAEEGMKYAAQIKDPISANMTKLLMYQEFAYYELEYQNYCKVIDVISKANQLLDSSPEDSKSIFTANNQQLLGEAYLGLNDYKEALTHFKKAEPLVAENDGHFIATLIHTGLTKTYLGLGDTKTAKEHLDIAERLGKDSKFLHLKNELLATSTMYYFAVNDVDHAHEKIAEQVEIKDQIRTKEKEFLDASLMESKKTTYEAESKSELYNTLMILAVTLLILFTAIYLWHTDRQHKKLQEFRKVIKSTKEKYESQHLETKVEATETDREKIPISPKMHEKILLKLNEFENRQMFTNKKMNLPTLAIFCETNVKYLSYVLNKDKKKDFNNYINELRVYYVIAKLETDKQFRKYKILVLADEAGFSTPNKFATIFKQITNYTPSEYIRNLKQ